MEEYKKQWKFIVFKLSWQLLKSPDFSDFVQYLKKLQSQWIEIALVVGWGKQISISYTENTWELRELSEDGDNHTSLELLHYGVLPAYEKVIQILSKVFWQQSIHIHPPESLMSKKKESHGLTWELEQVDVDFIPGMINVVSFVWYNASEWVSLNINADDIVVQMVEQYKDKIDSILYLTNSGWLLDRQGGVMSFMDFHQILQVLYDCHPDIEVNAGMRKKIESVFHTMQHGVAKLSICWLDWVSDELEWLFWSGTMMIDISQAETKKLNNPELFDMIYDHYVGKWDWVQRDDDEKKEMYDNYHVVTIWSTILWWYALSNFEDQGLKWKLLEWLCVMQKWNGIWSYIIKQITGQWFPIFAASKNEWFFLNHGFQELEGAFSLKSWSNLFIHE